MTHYNNGPGTLGQPSAGQPPKPPKGKHTALKVFGGIGIFILGVTAMGALSDDDPAATPAEAVASTYTAPTMTYQAQRPAATTTPYVAPTTRYVPPPAAAAPASYPQDKLLKIGRDIEPGTYTYEVPEGTIMAGFLYYCTVGANCNDAISADDSEMFSVGESGEYVVPASGYIKLDDVHLTPAE